jgi:hypothetical protein
MTVGWTNPSSVSIVVDELFDQVNISAATLRVPAGTKALYLATPVWQDFTIVEYPVSNETIDTPTLKAYASDGIVYISGLQPGMPLSIYTIAGQLVYKGIAKAAEESVPINASGIYIVLAGKQTAKTVIN